jgi:predicted nucleic acid-binding protein
VSYWDTSAIVPLLVREADSKRRESDLKNAAAFITWWGSRLEAVSAVERRRREGVLGSEASMRAMARLDALSERWALVRPTDLVLARAERLLRVHPLRAADAFQLAAALVACEERTAGEVFHCGDGRLREAARLEGFAVGA